MSPSPTTLARIGAVAWILGAAQFFVAHVITELAWPTGHSWAANNISDLGNIHCGRWDETRPRYVCSPLHDLMNTAIVIEGSLLILGILLTGLVWGRGFVSWAARVMLIIDAGGYILVALKPADVDENLHLLGALLIMGGGNLGLLLAGFAARRSPLGEIRWVTLTIAGTSMVAAVLFFGQYDLGFGLGGMERVAVFGLELWTVVTGVYVLIRSRPTSAAGGTRHFDLRRLLGSAFARR